jgi:lipoyl(octanoyl) transferase
MTMSIPENRSCRVISFPTPVSYDAALRLQYETQRLRQSNEVIDTLLLMEHPPTITLGRGTELADLRTDRDVLEARGITVVDVDRGGEITYHAPGQIVGYPILDLRQHGQDLHRYLRDLEEVLIRVLDQFGLTGERIPGLTGVWVGGSKIAAMGIRVSRWVTMHGFALNITPDLGPMRQDFIPCGIQDRGVTSLAEQISSGIPSRAEVEKEIIRAFGIVFRVRMQPEAGNSAAGLGIMGP